MVGLGHVDAALVYLDIGDDEKAREQANVLLRHRPDFTVEGWKITQQCKDPQRLKRDSEGLMRIGLP